MSPYLLAIIMIVVVLSVFSIYYGVLAYLKEDFSNGALFLAMGASTLIVATYLLLQTRRRMLKLSVEFPKMNTSLECTKCGNKNVREFQRGDYVYKKTEDQCSKCNEKTVTINAIFREVKEKEKAKEVTYGF
jgi:hypothetical protein